MVTNETLKRSPLGGVTEAFSGARLERVELTDGRRLIYKHLPVGGDWLTRVSGGADRLRRLWDSGVLSRVRPVVDHAIVDVVADEDHDIVVMRDVSELLLTGAGPVGRDVSQRLLAGLAALHDVGRDEQHQDLCPVAARYGMFAPARHTSDRGPNPRPAREQIGEGWQLFAERTDPDLADAVWAVHRDPMVLGHRLAQRPTTLLHGDMKLTNLGLGPDGLIAIDWGDLTGFGPPAIDVAWYALMNTLRIDATPDDVFADYQAAAGQPLDQVALDLACVGSLAQMGWRFSRFAAASRDAPLRVEAGRALEWWTARALTALDRLGGL